MSYERYLALQLKKSGDPVRQEKWKTIEWAPKLGSFKQTFTRLWADFDLTPSKALLVGARTGQEVQAAIDLGCDAVGIDLIAYPPLVVEGDMHDIPFPNEAFDFTYSNCFDHSLYPGKMVSELERVTRSGGVIVVQVQMNKPDDKFGVTDLFAPEAIESLFLNSRIEASRPIDKPALSMNYEVIAYKN